MGRIAKRVPMDFDAPLGKVWGGYLTPERLREERCPDCENGLTPDGELIQGVAYMIVGLADDVLDQERGREMHPYLRPIQDVSYVHGSARPTARFAEFVKGLNPDDRGPGLWGRDPYGMARRLIELAGLDEKWDWCPTCEGNATVEKYPGQRAEADAWEPIEPPTGEGWQMWETTSDGSPLSPVFATPEELAEWCVDGATVFGCHRAGRDEWLRIITGEDFAHITIAPGVVVM